ncbi:glycosyltransferase family 8 protein [Halorubrum sp. HHNYT27]|uniref:glycosyltransferase family 8 protein n=1 Tax=Halorubrum sp. HHNYT27 TaxID=3402275 RepID=UPI003EBCD650
MVLHIAYIVGGDAWYECFASIASLLDNNNKNKFHIHIISEEEYNKDFFQNIEYLNNIHGKFDITFIHVPGNKFDCLPDSNISRIPKGVNIKLLLGDLLPEDVTRVLYLDSDTIVKEDILPIMNEDISDYVVAAAPDYWNSVAGLNVSLEKRYFNAGVMYINIKKWRNENIASRSIEFIEKYNPYSNEQTALNAVLHRDNNVKIISPIWNFPPNTDLVKDGNIDIDYTKIKILHYASTSPWRDGSDSECDIWENYYKLTDYTATYANFEPTFIKRVALGICKYLKLVHR